MSKKISIFIISILLPAMTFAEDDKGVGGFLDTISGLFQKFYTLIFIAIGVMFAYGVLKYLASEDKGTESAKNAMVWPIVALVILMSVWGIVSMVQSTIGVSSDATVKAPKLPGVN